MTPEEFVCRCVNVGMQQDILNAVPYETMRSLAWVLRWYTSPIHFQYMGYDFELMMIEVNEVSNISARMTSENCIYHAMICLSKVTNKWFSHWEEEDGEDCDLTLLRVGSTYQNCKNISVKV